VFGIDSRTARAVWTAALVVAGLYCVYLVRTTLLVVLIAVLFSYLMLPLFVLGQRQLRPRWRGASGALPVVRSHMQYEQPASD
jgi:predicted PurR-regulated permease PerM